MTDRPLTGRAVLLTRPQDAAAGLAHEIERAGGRALAAPMIAITPLAAATDPALEAASRALLASAAILIFISPNAASFGLARLAAAGIEPGSRPVLAVGPGTALALKASGINALVPLEHYDSEGLLALPALAKARVKHRKVLIFRGRGGRARLAEALRERGADVAYCECYERRKSDTRLRAVLAQGQIATPDVGVVTSVESLGYLADSISTEGLSGLRAMPLVVPGARIAAHLPRFGFTQPALVVENPSDASIINRLTKWAIDQS